MAAYPQQLPTTEIRNVIASVTKGTVGKHRAGLANDLWTIQGFAQARMFGEPEPGSRRMLSGASRGPAELPTDEEAVSMLQTAIVTDEQVKADPEGPKMLAINWASVLIWVVKKSLPAMLGV